MLPNNPSLYLSGSHVVAAAVGGGASYAHKGAGTDTGSGSSTLTFTCDVGTATATRVILIGTVNQATTDFTSVTVNGVSLTEIAGTTSNSGHAVGFWSVVGASPGSGIQTIIVTGGTFFLRGAEVWTLDGLNSTTAKNVLADTGGSGSITTAVGDFLFANNSNGSAVTFGSSTEAPANTYDNHTAFQSAADWTIASTNGAFAITASTGGTDACAVTFR